MSDQSLPKPRGFLIEYRYWQQPPGDVWTALLLKTPGTLVIKTTVAETNDWAVLKPWFVQALGNPEVEIIRATPLYTAADFGREP